MISDLDKFPEQSTTTIRIYKGPDQICEAHEPDKELKKARRSITFNDSPEQLLVCLCCLRTILKHCKAAGDKVVFDYK